MAEWAVKYNKNTVDKMQNDQFHTTNLTQGDPMVAGVSANGWTQRIMEGEPIGTFYTYQYAGTVNGRSEYYVLDENGTRVYARLPRFARNDGYCTNS